MTEQLLEDPIDAEEEWFTLEDIEVEEENDDTLYCISVDAPEKQFLIGEEINVPTHNSEEGKEEDELKAEAALIIGSIARLGRAAGVHLCLATQRPDAKLIAGETKANLGARICCGSVDATASSMILDSGEGTRVRSFPKGRIYVKVFQNGNHAQGFFAPDGWLDKYFEDRGLNSDGTPKEDSAKQSRLAKVSDISKFADADLDEMEGVDNQSIIEQMRQADEEGVPYEEEEEDAPVEEPIDADDAPEPQKQNSGSKANDESRPELGGKSSRSKTKRHEDDWDSVMDEIHQANTE